MSKQEMILAYAMCVYGCSLQEITEKFEVNKATLIKSLKNPIGFAANKNRIKAVEL